MKTSRDKMNNRVFKTPSFYVDVFRKTTGSVSSKLMQLDGNEKVTFRSIQINACKIKMANIYSRRGCEAEYK